MSLSLDDLNQRLLSLDLLDLDKIRAVETSFGSKLFTADEFLRTAQRYGYLTKYQVERLMAGETTGFYYGDYRIQYLIGAGSFARVFRCVHRESGKVFAVKVLRARFRDDQTAIQEFIREGNGSVRNSIPAERDRCIGVCAQRQDGLQNAQSSLQGTCTDAGTHCLKRNCSSSCKRIQELNILIS